MPRHQQLTLPSNAPHFTAPPYHLHDEFQNLYTPSLSIPVTIKESRDTNNPQIYPHAFSYNPTITQLYMLETHYQFQFPALNYSKDHLFYGATTTANPYNFWFKNNFNFMHLRLTLLNLTN